MHLEGFSPCETCARENGGNGKGWVPGPPPIGKPCPSCSGSGMVPDADYVESLAQRHHDIADIPFDDALRGRVRTALLRYAAYIREDDAL